MSILELYFSFSPFVILPLLFPFIRYLEEKVEQICNQLRQNQNTVGIGSNALKGGQQINRRGSSAVIVGLPQERGRGLGSLNGIQVNMLLGLVLLS